MRQPIIAIIFLSLAITGYINAIPLDDVRDEIKSNNSTDSVSDEKPVINEGASTSTTTTKIEAASTTTTTQAPSPSTTEKLVEVKILETSSSNTTSIKSETTKAPTRTRTTRTTKTPRTRKTTVKPNEENATIKHPVTRQDWLKLIQSEMELYDKKNGNSPISNKNLTIISERILKYLVENGTQIGISLREQKDGTIKYIKGNSTTVNKIVGEGSESKFPPIIEFVVQNIQKYFSVYAYEDQSRPVSTEKSTNSNDLEATLREEKDEESSTLTNDQVFDQLEDELSEFIGSDVVKNVTDIKLPSLIKTAYEKIQSWFVPSTKPAAKEEPVQESEEEESAETTESGGTSGKPTKKPSIIKGAYDALEAILSVFDDIDVSDEEEKGEAVEKTDAELKESQDDLDETTAIKETVGENLYDFLKLAYTLYDEEES